MRQRLTWTHYRLHTRVKNDRARHFKDETVVRCSVLEGSEQLFASKYKLYLPTEEELARELRREFEAIHIEKGLE